MKKRKERADQLLVEQGLAESREQAKRFIMEGIVSVAGTTVRVEKPGQNLSSDTRLAVQEKAHYVSRGAYKLLTLLEHCELDVTDCVCLDAGASTGGFTDCLLKHGARRVYAFDVGHNQLHESLRADPRVVSREGVNLRNPDPTLIGEPLDLLCADVSFISLTLILQPCCQWLKDSAKLCLLIKPQFEVGPHETVRGVVKDVEKQKAACAKIITFCQDTLGFTCRACIPSKIKGSKGNQEYMALFERKASLSLVSETTILP
ncbi:MAG: TlyA family RNA methyltransferase [Desulfovibrio sp.]|nr:TlyA family RNA methyltransferase [Desulfovibrio sp.]